jgi:hypothetical protein
MLLLLPLTVMLGCELNVRASYYPMTQDRCLEFQRILNLIQWHVA